MLDDEGLFPIEVASNRHRHTGANKSAWISDDGLYRYDLTRTWHEPPVWKVVTFVMLNPSTADALVDDPTIRRCIGFAREWGYHGLTVVNVYGLRATDPKGLWLAEDPVGPQNDRALADAADVAKRYKLPIVAAWGTNAKPERIERVLALPNMDRLLCLGVTKDGHPKHPLYLRGDSRLTPWPATPERRASDEEWMARMDQPDAMWTAPGFRGWHGGMADGGHQ